MTDRDAAIAAADRDLLAACTVETYRASGPGGQHRNRTDSAVRLTHEPTGVTVTATERRSQHENRRVAVWRMRQALALEVREPADPAAPPAGALAEAIRGGRWPKLNLKRPDDLAALAAVLDRLEAAKGRASDAAKGLGVSTASLVKCLQGDPDVWTAANRLRRRHGQKPLR